MDKKGNNKVSNDKIYCYVAKSTFYCHCLGKFQINNTFKKIIACLYQISMFAYDPKTSKCVNFTYGGCAGNGNRFFSKSSCQDICVTKTSASTSPTTKITTTTTLSKASTCDKPSKSTCDGKNATFYSYNKTKDKCEKDTGCSADTGNGRFKTKTLCENLCKTGQQKLEPGQCLLPPTEGPCGGALRRYFYDVEEGKCLEFRYGGCHGNVNNFESKKDCEFACKGSERRVIESLLKEVCSLPKVRGPCTNNFRRFFYDNSTNTCKEFEFSGCGGNDNQVTSQLNSWKQIG